MWFILTITSNIKWKSLLINIAIPLAVGGVASMITMDGFSDYKSINQPPLSPPSWLFPIVWTILYVLMGISSYLIYEKDDSTNKKALTLYAIQLALNFIYQWDLKKQTALFVSEKIYKAIRKLSIIGKKTDLQ